MKQKHYLPQIQNNVEWKKSILKLQVILELRDRLWMTILIVFSGFEMVEQVLVVAQHIDNVYMPLYEIRI